jgi:adenosylmethionine---8-amino-7-oxononanoate aminotransferase
MESTNWLEKDKKYVWHPFTQALTADDNIVIERAESCTLFASDGKEYIDANSSWWVNVHGHCHPHIQEAIINQVSVLDHTIFAGATHPQAIKLSERICQILTATFKKVFFSDNGSTAVEVALKMVFQYWFNKNLPKKRIIALEGAYHGDTFGAMAVGERGYFNQPFEHFFFDVDYIPFPTKTNESDVLSQLKTLLESGEIAAVIVEPLIQGSAGMRVYSPELLDELIVLSHKFEALVIFDEVMTAWGRTGRLFALNHCFQTPDIVCLSKGLTGGVLPLGLTVATEEIYEAFLSTDKLKALLHGHSFTGNALSCAVANASLDIFEAPETWESIELIEKKHIEFAGRLSHEKNVKDIAVFGTIIRFEIETGEGNTYFSSIRDEAYRFFIENGCLIRPLGNVIFLNPPYSISEEELDQLYSVIIGFLRKLD